MEFLLHYLFFKYSASRLIGSRIIESAAYCNQKLLSHLYLNITYKTRRLIESFGSCYFYVDPFAYLHWWRLHYKIMNSKDNSFN